MKNKIKELQKILNIKFKKTELLLKSITHKSYDAVSNFEKLEFLGDRVLGLVISRKLIELYPNEKVGILDKKLANLVNKEQCYEIGKSLNLHKFILMGNIKKNLNFSEKKIISDCI